MHAIVQAETFQFLVWPPSLLHLAGLITQLAQAAPPSPKDLELAARLLRLMDAERLK